MKVDYAKINFFFLSLYGSKCNRDGAIKWRGTTS